MFTEYNYDAKMFDGFEFAVYSSYQAVRNQAVKACIISPNKIAIKMPGFHFGFHNRYDETYRVQQGDERYCEQLHMGHNLNRSRLNDNTHLGVRVLLFHFPSNMVLSNSIFSPAHPSQDDPIKSNTTMIAYTYETRSGQEANASDVRVGFRVHIVPDVERKFGEAVEDDDLDDLDAAFEAMATNDRMRP